MNYSANEFCVRSWKIPSCVHNLRFVVSLIWSWSAGEMRNDLYVTLEKGEFEKGGKSVAKNVEVTLYVLDIDGQILKVNKSWFGAYLIFEQHSSFEYRWRGWELSVSAVSGSFSGCLLWVRLPRWFPVAPALNINKTQIYLYCGCLIVGPRHRSSFNTLRNLFNCH